jgi:hypothetical protein
MTYRAKEVFQRTRRVAALLGVGKMKSVAVAASMPATDHALAGKLARLVVILVALAVLLLGVLPARAALIVPGGSMLAASDPAPGGVIIDSIASPFATAFYSGMVITNVISGDGTNGLGGLTFTYQVTLAPASPGGVDRVNGIDYSSFLTDASYVAGTGTSVAPSTMDRGFTGAQVGFNFVPPPLGAGVLLPGTTSPLLVVRTNAPAYQPGLVNIIDGAVTAVASFGPAIPEPTSAGLLLACVTASLIRRRS